MKKLTLLLLSSLISLNTYSGIVNWEDLYCKSNISSVYTGMYSVSLTSDVAGNIYVLGYGEYMNGINTVKDIVVIKYDSDGLLLADTVLGVDSTQTREPVKIASGKNGLIYILSGALHNNGKYLSAVIAVNSDLQKVWSDVLSSTNVITNLQPKDLNIDKSNNVLVAGNCLRIGQGKNIYAYRIKTNLTRKVLYYNNLQNTSGDEDAAKIKTDGKGNVYVVGYQTSASNAKEFLTWKLNNKFVSAWIRTHNGEAGNGDDFANDLAFDNNNNVYVTGRTYTAVDSARATTIKYDTAGVVKFTNDWIDGREGTAIGYYNDAVFVSGTKFMMNKYEKINGALIWHFPGSNGGFVGEVDFDNYNNIYMTGYTDTIVNGQLTIQGLFIKLDSVGTKVWKVTMPATFDNGIVNYGKYVGCEIVKGQGVYFEGRKYTKSNGKSYCLKTQQFIEEYTTSIISTSKIPENEIEWNVLNNPVENILTISSNNNRTLILYDVTGKKIAVLKCNSGETTFELSFLKPGVYFLKPEFEPVKDGEKIIKL